MVELKAQKRETQGSRAARRMRAQGHLPGIVYGHKEDTVALSLVTEEVEWAIRHGARVVDLRTDGSTEKALIREVQWDPLGKEVLHIDFERVREDERVRVTVPVEIRGIPAGVTGGGVLDQPIHILHIESLPNNLPESIRVNVTELALGAAIHVRDLKLPPGVTALDPEDAVVVHVQAPQAEETPAPTEAGQAEPEVIGRQKAEEQEEA